jgi:hypothetical protein
MAKRADPAFRLGYVTAEDSRSRQHPELVDSRSWNVLMSVVGFPLTALYPEVESSAVFAFTDVDRLPLETRERCSYIVSQYPFARKGALARSLAYMQRRSHRHLVQLHFSAVPLARSNCSIFSSICSSIHGIG